MTLSLLPALVLLLPVDGDVGDADLVVQAQTEFAEGLRLRRAGERSRSRFLAAVAACEELRRRGASNAPLYRNLGNARLLAGDLAGAILSYREGLRIAPGDRLLRQSLAEARERVAFAEGSRLGRPPEDVRPAWLASLGMGWLFATAFLAYACGWVALTRWMMHRRGRVLLVGLVLLALALGGGALVFRDERAGPGRPIVVLAADGVLLRKGNSALFPPRYETPLNRGVEAELLFRRGGWLQIEVAGGEVGWVAAREAVVEGRE